jgi:hypothetical protein
MTVAGAVLALVHAAHAATWYVSTNGNDSAAGTNWATANVDLPNGHARDATLTRQLEWSMI